jgi:hypothetical protein
MASSALPTNVKNGVIFCSDVTNCDDLLMTSMTVGVGAAEPVPPASSVGLSGAWRGRSWT